MFHVISIPAVVILILTSLPCEAWQKDVKVRYYSSTILRCHENLTLIPDAFQVFWITPDNSLLTETTPPSQFPQNIHLVDNHVISVLNVTQINDDLFGYYTCVMVKNNKDVVLARWGLNVDGADFSELEKQYRKNAIVGAIAAGVMIVLLGGACLIWHYRYSKRTRGDETESLEEDLKKTSNTNVFQNYGYDEPLPRMEENGASNGKKAIQGDIPLAEMGVEGDSSCKESGVSQSAEEAVLPENGGGPLSVKM